MNQTGEEVYTEKKKRDSFDAATFSPYFFFSITFASTPWRERKKDECRKIITTPNTSVARWRVCGADDNSLSLMTTNGRRVLSATAAAVGVKRKDATTTTTTTTQKKKPSNSASVARNLTCNFRTTSIPNGSEKKKSKQGCERLKSSLRVRLV